MKALGLLDDVRRDLNKEIKDRMMDVVTLDWWTMLGSSEDV
jgi:hypothetical protein